MRWTNRSSGSPRPIGMMIFVFRSGKQATLSAFAATDDGEALPPKFAPWTLIGSIPPGRSLPHGLSRASAEAALKADGFALWRMKSDETPSA
jgi:hypothetical protein